MFILDIKSYWEKFKIMNSKNTYVIDIDETICEIIKPGMIYIDAVPKLDVINQLNKLYDQGHTIILFTARGMKTYNNDIRKIYQYVYPVIEKWCKKHNVKYHQLIMGKPWGENVFYVDDKNLTISEFLEH
jgi:capsule biosynthesis phosphatase